MIRAVLDTNILVSAFWSKDGNAARILRLFFDSKLLLIYSREILNEYKVVLGRPVFQFSRAKIGEIVNQIHKYGVCVEPPESNVAFTDESDRKFYDAAKTYRAVLVTGNQKHYPNSPFIKTAADFLTEYDK
jgi:putative PIN family toxin of toxin-antitoxin system